MVLDTCHQKEKFHIFKNVHFWVLPRIRRAQGYALNQNHRSCSLSCLKQQPARVRADNLSSQLPEPVIPCGFPGPAGGRGQLRLRVSQPEERQVGQDSSHPAPEEVPVGCWNPLHPGPIPPLRRVRGGPGGSYSPQKRA